MVRAKIINKKIIICPVCIKKKNRKRFSRLMDLNQHLAKRHPEFNYKIVPMKKLTATFSWIPRTKLN